VRNTAIRDKCTMPLRILAGGGRIAWNDAGNSPNVHFVYYDTGIVPVLFDLTNLPTKPGVRQSPNYKGTRSGYVIECEGGWYAGGRGGGSAFDADGQRIEKLSGDGGRGHAKNFIDAVRSRDKSKLTAPVETIGHHSSAWCNLANVAYQLGGKYSKGQVMEINKGYKPWEDLLETAREHYAAHGADLDSDQIKLSPILEMDPKTERFVGPNADEANKFLTREFRNKEYEIPAKV